MPFDITGCISRKIRWEDRSALAAKACLPIGRREGSGLLRSHLLVVVVMMVMMAVVMPVVMTMMVMLLHRSRVGAGGAEDRHGERQGQSQPERGEEGLLHDFVSFLRGRSETHRTKSVTQAPQWGLSSWFFSTIFPKCRFLFLDCFQGFVIAVRAVSRTADEAIRENHEWDCRAAARVDLTSAARRRDSRPRPDSPPVCRRRRAWR